MPALALGLAGAAIGGALITTPILGLTGAGIGWMVGSTLGSLLFQKGQRVEGPRLGDLQVQASTYGTMNPIIYGSMRVAGNVIFCTDKREVATETSEGGKGGPKVTSTTYSYNVDIAIALCQCEIQGIRKVWRNGELIYDVSDDADVGTVLGSSLHAESFTIYYGDETQLPDPTIEATIGVGLVPAYRGTAYVVFDHLDCPNGMIPQLTFEVTTAATGDASEQVYSTVPRGPGGMNFAAIGENISYQFVGANGSGKVYSVGPNYNEYERDIDFTASIGGAPVPTQGGPYAMRHYFESGSFGDPIHVQAYDLTTGSVALDYSYTPNTLANSLKPAFAAYDSVTGKFSAVASSSEADKYEVITIMPAGVETPVLDTPGAPHAFYDDVLYVCGDRAGITYLQTYDGTTGAFIDEVSAGTGVDNGRLLVHADANGVFVVQGEVGTGDHSIWQVTDEWTLLTDTGTFENADGQVKSCYVCDRYAIVGPTTSSGNPANLTYTLISYASITPATVLLADVIEDICVRGGMDVAQVDTTGLADEVNGYALTQVSSARANLEPLLTAFFVDCAESDGVLKFRKRALQSTVATIPFEELGAAEAGSAAEDPMPLTRTQESELPRSVAVTYINMDADYQPGTETARRQVTNSIHDIATNIPIATYKGHVAAISSAMLYDTWQARNARRLKLTRKYAYLDVGDNIAVEYPEGTTSTKRINRMTDTGLMLELELTDSDAAIYEVVVPGVTPAREQDGIAYAYPSRAVYLDMPILRNADDDDGLYVAARSVVEAVWPGCLLYKSDGLNYQALTQISTESVIGVTTTALDSWTGPDVVDEQSSVQVSVAHGELSSSTRNAIVSGETNAMLIGSEVVQFHTATEDSPGVYTLTGLLRGRRGTEWAMTGHAIGERVVLLTTAMRRIPLTLTEVDTEIDYKAVTIGSSLDATSASAVTCTAIGKKPFAPVYLRMSEETGERVFTWERRTRMASNILTDSIPLGEESESYDVELLDTDDDVVYSATVDEREATVSALTEAFELPVAAQFVQLASSVLVGTVDKYPVQINAISLRSYNATTGASLESVSLGVTGIVTAVLTVGTAVYVATIDGDNTSYVRRYDATNLAAGVQATYTATADADAQGLAYDGTYIWVAEAYTQQVVRLNATTLATTGVTYTSIPAQAFTFNSGFLYAAIDNQMRKVDVTDGSVDLTFTCVTNATDVLVANGLIFVAGMSQFGVYSATSGVVINTGAGGTGSAYRRGVVLFGSEVVISDHQAGQLIFLSATTGAETRRLGVPNIWGIAGVDDDTLFVAIRNGSLIDTVAYQSIDDLTGYTFKVYQNSSHVGRGYVAELAL